jgi:hypothetical protein
MVVGVVVNVKTVAAGAHFCLLSWLFLFENKCLNAQAALFLRQA